MPAALYGRETLPLTLWEEHKLKVFENRVLRKMFVPTNDEVTGDWTKLYNVERQDSYSSRNIILSIGAIKSRRVR